MKKLMALLLALTLVMGLVACGNNNTGNETTTTPADTTPVDTGDAPVDPDEGDIDIPLTPMHLLLPMAHPKC